MGFKDKAPSHPYPPFMFLFFLLQEHLKDTQGELESHPTCPGKRAGSEEPSEDLNVYT
jgi:hypothetical protein